VTTSAPNDRSGDLSTTTAADSRQNGRRME
jgi:hypothetical protein